MTKIHPYLTFEGNCEEAFNFYRSVLGGEFLYLSRFKDMPACEENPIAEADKEKIMHIRLRVGENGLIMGSDHTECCPVAYKSGNQFSVSLHVDSDEEADRIFSGLSRGGEIMMRMQTMFWGAYFGMFTDRYGVHWMIAHEPEKLQQSVN